MVVLAAVIVVAGTNLFAAVTRPGSGLDLGGSARAAQVHDVEVRRLIGVYEAKIADRPTAPDLLFLAGLYADVARRTGDIGAYGRAEQAVEQSLTIAPEYRDALVARAQLLHATHDFVGARDVAEQVLVLQPDNPDARAVLGDALLAVGDIGGATETYGPLLEVAGSDPAVAIRTARLAYLSGDAINAALDADRALQLALDQGVLGTDLAWYLAADGALAFDLGDYGKADERYRQALEAAPNYHIAQAGLARARAAQGDTAGAIELYQRAIEAVPDPSYLAALGDLYLVQGDSASAEDQYATVELIATLADLNRQLYNRQLSLFFSDHDREIDRAVTLAESELAIRQDVYGWDAYAWALYKAGRITEAAAASEQALAWGTPDAVLEYHAGMIALTAGQAERAEALLASALERSPFFDPLQSPIAHGVLAELEEQT